MKLKEQFKKIDKEFGAYVHHTIQEMMEFYQASVDTNLDGCLVECGVYQGIGTAKFSLVAEEVNKKLYAFDSFEGIPENTEPHDKNIWGNPARFHKGDFCAGLEEATENLKRFGRPERVEFIKGWFDETLPKFKKPISVIYLDVDLAESTETCLKYLWPLLQKGGILLSQDGHLPLVIKVFEKFAKENNVIVHGLGKQKLVKIIK